MLHRIFYNIFRIKVLIFTLSFTHYCIFCAKSSNFVLSRDSVGVQMVNRIYRYMNRLRYLSHYVAKAISY